jgi:hypothetical protein
MEGVNHIPHLEDHEKFIEIVLSFLSGSGMASP